MILTLSVYFWFLPFSSLSASLHVFLYQSYIVNTIWYINSILFIETVTSRLEYPLETSILLFPSLSSAVSDNINLTSCIYCFSVSNTSLTNSSTSSLFSVQYSLRKSTYIHILISGYSSVSILFLRYVFPQNSELFPIHVITQKRRHFRMKVIRSNSDDWLDSYSCSWTTTIIPSCASLFVFFYPEICILSDFPLISSYSIWMSQYFLHPDLFISSLLADVTCVPSYPETVIIVSVTLISLKYVYSLLSSFPLLTDESSPSSLTLFYHNVFYFQFPPVTIIFPIISFFFSTVWSFISWLFNQFLIITYIRLSNHTKLTWKVLLYPVT